MPHALTMLIAVLAVGAAVVAIVGQRWVMTATAVTLAVLATVGGRFDRSAAIDGVDAVVFVAAMVLVAAGAERSGLLATLAGRLVKRVPGHLRLLLATFAAGVVLTTFLNLDTTAVLFTPLAVSIAATAGRDRVPFALAALAAANFGSMLLPTSNLTNLVLWRHSGDSYVAFAGSLAPVAAVAAITVAVALVAVSAWRGRRADRPVGAAAGTVDGDGFVPPRLDDRRLALVSGGVVAGLVVVLTLGAPVVVAAPFGAALVLAVRPALWRERLPLVLVLAVLALFVAAGALRGEVDVVALAGATSTAGLAVAGAVVANVGSNLASVLLLQPLANGAVSQRALLIGVNLGAGVTPIGSLATILWRDALRRRDVELSWATFVAFSCPLSVILMVTTLLLAR